MSEVLGVSQETVRRDTNVSTGNGQIAGSNGSESGNDTNVSALTQSVVTTYTGEDEWYTPTQYKV